MHRIRLLRWFAACCRRSAPLLLCMLAWGSPVCRAVAAEAPPEIRVLHLNSSQRGNAWSDGIEEGLRQHLTVAGKAIELSVEYLDSRRAAYGSQIEPMARALEVKYAKYRPQLLVVSANAAFDFALKYRERLFADLPIVFCGYNSFQPELLRWHTNITGVNEEIGVADTVAMAMKVHPQARTLVFITSTAEAAGRRVAEAAEATAFPQLAQRYQLVQLNDASPDEIRRRLAALPSDALVFLGGQVGDSELSPAGNGRLSVAASAVPSCTFWDFHPGQWRGRRRESQAFT